MRFRTVVESGKVWGIIPATAEEIALIRAETEAPMTPTMRNGAHPANFQD